MKKKWGIFLLSILLATGCNQPKKPVETHSNVCIDCGFDTFFAIQGYAGEQETFDALFEEASTSFKHYHQLYDIYHEYPGVNNLKTINDNAGKQPVEVDQEIIDLLKNAKEYYDLSSGQFDITMGALLKIWHNYRTSGMSANEDGEYGRLPKDEKLKEAAQYHGFEHVIIDEQAKTVYIDDEHISLDVGGIAKGYATEQVAKQLMAKGVNSGAVNAGGNNRTLGPKADGTSWRVGIQNPRGSGSLLTIAIDGVCSFVTSGDYERYYVAEDEQNYHHIIDPKTYYPARYFHSVSVVTTDSGAADCLSTTLFTVSYEEGLKLIEEYKKENPDYILEVIWITDQDQQIDTPYQKVVDEQLVIYTEGLAKVITWQN